MNTRFTNARGWRLGLLALQGLLVANALGSGWQKVTGPPAGVAATAVGAGSGSTLYAGFGSSGLYRSTDNGLTWSAVNGGLLDGTGTALPPAALVRMGAGTIVRGGANASWNNRVGSAVFYSTNGGSWSEASYPFNTPSKNISGAVSFTGFVEAGGALYASDMLSHAVWKSTDSGVTWTAAGTGIPTMPFQSVQFAYDVATDGASLYAATPNSGVWKSVSGGTSWTEDNAGIPGTFSGLGTIRVATDLVVLADGRQFAVVDDRLYHRTTAASAWSELDSSLFGAGKAGGSLRKLATSGMSLYTSGNVNGNTAIAESTDAGATWQFVSSTGLPAGIASILTQSFGVHNGALYHTAADGLYRVDLATADRTPVAPVILTADGTRDVNVGSPLSIAVSLNRASLPLTYRWEKGGTLLGTQTTAALSLAAVTTSDAGTYTLTVTNGGGSDVATFTVAVHPVALGARDYSFNAAFGSGTVASQYIAFSSINALAIEADGRILAGGEFATVNGLNRPRLVRLTRTGTVDAGWDNSTVFPYNDVFTVAILASGKPVIGYDDYRFVGGTGNSYLARLLGAGPPDTAFTVSDSGATVFYSGTKIYAVAEQADGKLLAAGRLSRGGILRFGSNGVLDRSWADSTISSSSDIFALRVLPSGKVLIGGNFTQVRGQNVSRLARLHADGTLDTSFSAALPSTVKALAVLPDGRLLVGGSSVLVRLQPNGALDSSFSLGGNGPAGDVNALAVQENGKLLVGGSFTTWNGDSGGARLVRLQADGTRDGGFAASLNAQVNALALQADGHVLVAGAFTAGLIRVFGDTLDPALFQQPLDLTVNLGQPAEFTVAAEGTAPLSYQWRRNSQALLGAESATLRFTAAARTDSGTYDVVVTGGAGSRTSRPATLTVLAEPLITRQPEHVFAQSGQSVTLSVAANGVAPLSYRWLKNGGYVGPATGTPDLALGAVTAAADADYAVEISNSLGAVTSRSVAVVIVGKPGARDAGYNPGTGPNGLVRAISAAGEKAYLGGAFSQYSGTNRDRLARVQADGTLDGTFAPPAGVFGEVRALAVAAAGGLFAGGVTTNYFTTALRKFLPDGTSDSSFTAAAFDDGSVWTLALQPDGRLLVGGGFTTYNGQSWPRLVRLNPDGSADDTFSIGTGFSGTVYALALQPDGTILAGGQFSTFNGQSTPNLVRLTADGTLDSSFSTTANPLSNTVRALLPLADGRLLIGGSFSSLGGNNQRHYLARLLATGAVDTTFAAAGVDNSVYGLAATAGGQVLAAGAFSYFGGATRGRVAAFTADGVPDAAFDADPGASNLAYAVAASGQGQLWLGGEFTSYDGAGANYLVRLNGYPAALTVVSQPADLAQEPGTTAVFSVTAASPRPITYQWQKNGSDMPGQTGATLTLASLTLADNGLYRCVARNLFGEVTSREARLVVLDAPVIIQPPAGATVEAGTRVRLSVTAQGVAPLQYQWKRDGTAVDGAIASLLEFNPARVTDSGSYTVVVGNGLGNVESTPVTVNIFATASTPAYGYRITAPPTSGNVHDVAITADGRLYAAGSFPATVRGNRYLTRYLADGSEDPAFTVGSSISHEVHAVLPLTDGKVLVAGRFSQIGSTARARIARLNSDGSLDTGFTPPPNLLGYVYGTYVYDLAVTSDGKVYAAGDFTSIDGSTTAAGLVRLNANGTHDTSFSIGQGFTVGTQVATVRTVALLPDGRVLAGGTFTHFRGAPLPYLAALNSDGALDSTFAANGTPNAAVQDIDPTYTGELLVAGDFTALGGLTRNRLALLTVTGAVVPAFVPAVTFNSRPERIRDTSDGTIIVAGGFTVPSNRIAALRLTDGTTDSAFNFGAGFDGTVAALDVHVDGRILVGGSYAAYRGGNQYPRLTPLTGRYVPLAFLAPVAGVTVEIGGSATLQAAVHSDSPVTYQWHKGNSEVPAATAPDLTLAGTTETDEGLYTVTITNVSTVLTSQPAFLRVLSNPEVDRQPTDVDGTLYGRVMLDPLVVGAGAAEYRWYRNGALLSTGARSRLEIAEAQPEAAGLYELEAVNAYGTARTQPAAVVLNAIPGTPDPSFRPGTGFSQGANDGVLLADGRIVVGGAFSQYNGVATGRLTALLPDGTRDTTFTGVLGATANVVDLAVDRNGNILAAGGTLGTVNGTVLTGLARFSPAGVLDTAFAPMFDNTVNQVLPLADGRLAVGGHFATVNNVPCTGVAILNENGTLDTTFTSPLTANSAVDALAVDPDGNLLVGGVFGLSGGALSRYLTRLSATGTNDTAFMTVAAGWLPARVKDIQPLPGGQWLLAAQGAGAPLWRIRADGSHDTAFAPLLGSGTIHGVLVDPSGRIAIAAWLESGNTSLYMTRLLASGAADPTFTNPVLNGLCMAVLRDSRGRYLIVGQYTQAHGQTRGGITRVFGDSPPVQVAALSPSPTVTTGDAVTLQVVAQGTGTLQYRWYRGVSGDTTTPVDNGTGRDYTTPALAATSPYWVRVTDAYGSVDSATVTVTVIAPPVITVAPVAVTLSLGAAAPDLMAGVSAVDYQSTDLTAAIAVSVTPAGGVNTAVPGTYTATYTVTDAGGRAAVPQTRTYRVVDDVAPVITLTFTELTLPVGLAANVRQGVSASDNVDGDLTGAVVVGGAPLNVQAAGDYTVTYDVSDTAGNPALQRTRVYHVVVDEAAPVLTVTQTVVALATGGAVEPPPAAGVSATDAVDGDLTGAVVITGSTPVTTAPGDFTITYTVTDFSGNIAEATRLYRVRHVATVDSDGDQLDDAWEQQHFGDLRWLGTDDADGDGLDNLEEFGLGRNPRAYTLQLHAGWNLVSLLHLPGTRAIADLLVDDQGGVAQGDAGWIWNAQRGVYFHTRVLTAFTAVWVRALRNATLEIQLPSPESNSPAPTEGDTDGDGLNDAWEQQHFGSLRFHADDDPDGDGLNNGFEALSGGHPRGYTLDLPAGWNLLSLPHQPTQPSLTHVIGMGLHVGLQWDAVAREYRRTDSLDGVTGTWIYLQQPRTGATAITVTLP